MEQMRFTRIVDETEEGGEGESGRAGERESGKERQGKRGKEETAQCKQYTRAAERGGILELELEWELELEQQTTAGEEGSILLPWVAFRISKHVSQYLYRT